jgi:CubicO group peptidase (beta-lactamase class C family)
VTHGWGDLELQPRDMAKIGYLWLNEGLWDGKQLVPKTYLRAATALHFRNPEGEGYGYGFWVHPEVAGGIFEATGRGGQRITVLSSKRIGLAITAASVLRAATATASEAPATTARRRPGPRHRQPNHG